ncbi:MAG: clostripain-related cysteine peptidase [Oligoflexia bacterium]|nr:clostripain-related cysteine peptidase [Oligoflexia bacterium]
MRTSAVTALLLALAAGLSGPAVSAAAADPSSCRQAWSKEIRQGLHRYDSQRDGSYARFDERLGRERCVKDWTVLVYMAADNDLTPYALLDLYEMEAGYASGIQAAGSTLSTDLVVQLDTEGDRGLQRIHVFQSPEPYDPSGERGIHSPVVERLAEDPRQSESRRFGEFLEWGIRNYPSRHYLVVVWGHGQGWTAARPRQPARSRYLSRSAVGALGIPVAEKRFGGIALNGRSQDYLSIPELRKGLRSVSRKLLGGRPIDIYASDACLMQMAEVATELSDSVEYIVGSAQVQNYLGLPYRRLLHALNQGTAESTTPERIARLIPKAFKASLAPNGLQGRLAPDGIKTVTMSAISASELRHQLLPTIDALGRRLSSYLREDPLRAIDLQFVLQEAPTVQGGAQEIGAFLTLLQALVQEESSRNGGLSPEASRLLDAITESRKALDRTVLAYATGTDYTRAETQLYLLGFRALTVWLPVSSEDYASRIGDFASAGFYRLAPGWAEWLRELYAPGR